MKLSMVKYEDAFFWVDENEKIVSPMYKTAELARLYMKSLVSDYDEAKAKMEERGSQGAT